MSYMDQVQRKKLLELADFLDKLPELNWMMNAWLPGLSSLNNEYNIFIPKTVDAEIKCGTSCCVAGWGVTLHHEEWPAVTWHDMQEKGDELFASVYGLQPEDALKITRFGLEMSASAKATQIRGIVLEKYEE